MDKKLKRRWLNALRSGKYRQARSSLRIDGDDKDDAFCCLGVLCDLIDPAGWTKRTHGNFYLHDGDAGMPSEGTLEKAGLSDSLAGFLAKKNDEGRSFKQIANMAERRV